MDNLFARLKLEHWYQLFAAVGAAGLIATLTFDTGVIDRRHALLLTLGMFLVGIGESINHTFQIALVPPSFNLPGGGKLTKHFRANQPLGIVLDAVGLLLIATALYKIAKAS